MIAHGKTVLLAVLLIPGVALAQLDLGETLGVSKAAIRAALDAKGYTATEFEFEDDEIEVEATRNGQAYEIEISAVTGLVLGISLDDEDDGSADYDDDETMMTKPDQTIEAVANNFSVRAVKGAHHFVAKGS